MGLLQRDIFAMRNGIDPIGQRNFPYSNEFVIFPARPAGFPLGSESSTMSDYESVTDCKKRGFSPVFGSTSAKGNGPSWPQNNISKRTQNAARRLRKIDQALNIGRKTN